MKQYAVRHQNLVAELRATLPIKQYLDAIHSVATCGELPYYDSNGNRVEGHSETVTVDARLSALEFLVNKILPSPTEAKVTVDSRHGSLEQLASLPADIARRSLSAMSTEELAEMAHSTLLELGSRTAVPITVDAVHD